MLGVKRIERISPVGSFLTVVGEGMKGNDGTFRIQGPKDIFPVTIGQEIGFFCIFQRLLAWSAWVFLRSSSWKICVRRIFEMLENSGNLFENRGCEGSSEIGHCYEVEDNVGCF